MASDTVTFGGFNRIDATLKKLRNRYNQEGTKPVIAGYFGVNYAIFVHENLKAKHKPGKTAKFLETPARENQEVYAKIIESTVKMGGTIQEALKLAAVRLQADSQKIVPHDTGNLKGSAGVQIEQ